MRSLSRSSSGRLGATLRRVAPVVLALLAAAPLRAQGTIRGVLFDSLRTRAGIPGVEVVLLGAGRRATTDGRGRFEFLDVPVGAAEVAWGSPSLDSLGLPPLRARVNVANAAVVDVRLATVDTLYGRLGDWFVWLSMVVVGVAAALSRRPS